MKSYIKIVCLITLSILSINGYSQSVVSYNSSVIQLDGFNISSKSIVNISIQDKYIIVYTSSFPIGYDANGNLQCREAENKFWIEKIFEKQTVNGFSIENYGCANYNGATPEYFFISFVRRLSDYKLNMSLYSWDKYNEKLEDIFSIIDLHRVR